MKLCHLTDKVWTFGNLFWIFECTYMYMLHTQVILLTKLVSAAERKKNNKQTKNKQNKLISDHKTDHKADRKFQINNNTIQVVDFCTSDKEKMERKSCGATQKLLTEDKKPTNEATLRVTKNVDSKTYSTNVLNLEWLVVLKYRSLYHINQVILFWLINFQFPLHINLYATALIWN